jgi:hypothetical protein
MSPRRGIVAYVVSATLARSADAGAIVGVVLLGNASPGGAALGGALAAALTAPHLAGPFLAPLLDRARRPQAFLASALVLYAVCVAGAVVLIAGGMIVGGMLALLVAGSCGPFLTGGLSSRLGGLVRQDEGAQRRAQGLDALTYGIAASCGPAVVALLASTVGAALAVLTVAGLATVAAVALFGLPADASDARSDIDRPTDPAREPRAVLHTLATLLSIGSLRRVTLGVSLTALAMGALPLLAVAAARSHGLGGPGPIAILVASGGLGSLAGSLALTARPLSGSAEPVLRRATLALAGCLLLTAVAPTLVLSAIAFGILGAVSSVQFTSSLAVRSESSPPGARAQVFVTMAALKVACASLGVATAGIIATRQPLALLVGVIAIPLLAFVVMRADAAVSGRRTPALPALSP